MIRCTSPCRLDTRHSRVARRLLIVAIYLLCSWHVSTAWGIDDGLVQPGALQIALFDDDVPGCDRELAAGLAAQLRADGTTVTLLSAAQVCDPTVLSPDRFFLYIIPQCRVYPAAGLDALAAFASGRGHILCMGGPLLDDPVWRADESWFNRASIASAKNGAEPMHTPWSDGALTTAGWMRTTNDLASPGSWEVVPEGPQAQACFRFTAEHLTGWDGYLSPELPQLFGPQHELLTFLTKGSETTRQLVVEIQERDGSRWMAVVELGLEWQRVGLDASDFQYWPDSSPSRRGAADDRLRPAEARRIGFQLAKSHVPSLASGAHRFSVADVGTCPHPVRNLVLVTPPLDKSLETVFPRYKTYPVAGNAHLAPASHPVLPLPTDWPASNELICGIPRTTGRGFLRDQKWRFVPLLDAVNGDGRVCGSAAWLLLNHSEPYAGCVLAGLGINDPAVLKSPAAASAVSAIATRLNTGAFLREAGSQQFAYWPGEEISLGAEVVNVGAQTQTVQLRMTVTDTRQQPVLVESTTLEVPARDSRRWDSLRVAAGSVPGTCHVRTELMRQGEPIDRIEHDIQVLDTSTPPAEEFVTVKGSNFYVQDRVWYPVGINFWPLYVSGMQRDDFWAGWLRQRYYDPELAEQDLQRMAALGINVVSIQAPDREHVRNLLDFIRRCRRHNIYVNLFCGLASPLAFREQELKDFIADARLADNSTVMAYDTIWEPGNYVFQGDRRASWDQEWREWVIEQYGGVTNAEKQWGVAGRRGDEGLLISPPDKCFSEDGPWRTMMAAYRRFMDDMTSRKWNRAHRKLREIDPRHLVSFRQGNTLPHDFVFTGTPKHVDFICPEGYAIQPGDDGYHAAGFITKFVHFTTGGKPIVWAEFGQSVWDPETMSPAPARIEEVAAYHEMFYRMALESGANGTIPWWWPGGYREGEKSDFGIVNPDGSPRPAAQLIAEYGPRLKAERQWPDTTAWFDMDREAHSGGYWYVCFNTGRDAYRAAVAAGQQLAIRTAGTGTTSATTPLVAVGNQPCNGNNPPKFLNAEFNWLLVQDAAGQWVEATDGCTISVSAAGPVKARICVGNTQEATWRAPRSDSAQAGDVILQTSDASQLHGQWPLPADTAYLADADFGEITLAEHITQTTEVELRLAAVGRTPFGEKRTFRLQKP